jgi:hypothetical protein
MSSSRESLQSLESREPRDSRNLDVPVIGFYDCQERRVQGPERLVKHINLCVATQRHFQSQSRVESSQSRVESSQSRVESSQSRVESSQSRVESSQSRHESSQSRNREVRYTFSGTFVAIVVQNKIVNVHLDCNSGSWTMAKRLLRLTRALNAYDTDARVDAAVIKRVSDPIKKLVHSVLTKRLESRVSSRELEN